jgi:hypothetical protein
MSPIGPVFAVKSLGLSTPNKTRHSRHLRANRLILLAKVMSGSSKKPDIDPTFPAKNPTFGWQDVLDGIPHTPAENSRR